MKVILQATDDAEYLVLQARAAAASLRKGRPSGNPAFHLFTIGTAGFSVAWNKASVTVWPQSMNGAQSLAEPLAGHEKAASTGGSK